MTTAVGVAAHGDRSRGTEGATRRQMGAAGKKLRTTSVLPAP